jgi:adenosylcobinamide-phosphate synthase
MILDRAVQLLLILVIEAAVGYPQALYRRARHPVAWIGMLIKVLEKKWNAGSERGRRVAGCALLVVLVTVAGGAGWLIESFCGTNVPGTWEARKWPTLVVVLVATTAIAQRSLHDHVIAVLQPLQAGDLATARRAVSRIVGRDTEALDAEGISAAAIESLAESFCDGIVAPASWFLAAGLPGLFICKAINTADSMVGHKDARYRAFGWAAARADDLVNLVPARISGLLICLAGCGGLRVMLRDAHKHASPNAGWSEAAMAGALALQLGGPVSYDGEVTSRPLLGNGRHPDPASLRAALRIYCRACVALWLIVGGVAWLR